MDKGKGLDFFLGFLTGTLVGAAIAIILAPQSGEETREYLKDQAIYVRDKASEVAASMRDRATEIASEVKEKADKMRDKAILIASEVKESVTKSREDGTDETSDEKAEELAGDDKVEKDNIMEDLEDLDV